MPDPWENILNWLRADAHIPHGPPSVGQTTGGKHAAGSYHYRRTAMDSGWSDADASRVARTLEPYALGPGRVLAELFESRANIFISHGDRFGPSRSLRQLHTTHCHSALYEGRWLPHAHRPVPVNLPPPPKQNPNLKVLNRGDTGGGVKWLQYALLCITGAPKPPIDGNFGPATERAVIAFQRFFGITPASGGVGPRTKAMLNYVIAQRWG